MEEIRVDYNIDFNKRSDYIEEQQMKSAQSKTDGPLVERKCSKCGNETMSYASLQLRSADEGQTIFYTCTKCQHKETENSWETIVLHTWIIENLVIKFEEWLHLRGVLKTIKNFLIDGLCYTFV